MPWVDENRCIGCGICANICPAGIEIVDGKAVIKNENTDCLKDAAEACPRNAILLNRKRFDDKEADNKPMGFGQGRGMGQGFGRGKGLGSRDGRGMERGMGRRKKW